MSHFTKVKTGLKDIATLRKTLAKIGWLCVDAQLGDKVSVKGWEKRSFEADMKFNVGCSYEIGVNVEPNGELRLEADWWAIETFTQRTQQSLMDELTREYAYVTVMDKAHKLGYEVVEEKAGVDSEVRLLFEEMVMDANSGELEQCIGLNIYDAFLYLKSKGVAVGEIRYEESKRCRLSVVGLSNAGKDDDSRVDLVLAGQNPIRFLPSMYHDNDFLRRALFVFQHISYETAKMLDNQHNYFTPTRAPAEFVAWMASWFNMDLESAEDDASTRLLVQHAVSLFRRRGTVSGLKALLRIVTGIEPEILENGMPYGPYMISSSTVDAHVLEESGANSHFTVHFPILMESMEKERVARLSKLINAEKPAHTECFITFSEDPKPRRERTEIDDATMMGADGGILM